VCCGNGGACTRAGLRLNAEPPDYRSVNAPLVEQPGRLAPETRPVLAGTRQTVPRFQVFTQRREGFGAVEELSGAHDTPQPTHVIFVEQMDRWVPSSPTSTRQPERGDDGLGGLCGG